VYGGSDFKELKLNLNIPNLYECQIDNIYLRIYCIGSKITGYNVFNGGILMSFKNENLL